VFGPPPSRRRDDRNMKLISARVRMFRNIVDSGEIAFEDDVTCLVGKNESGKTALLNALHRLNPAPEAAGFDAIRDYPRWRYTRDRKDHRVDSVKAVSATFELEVADEVAVEEVFGPGVLTSTHYAYTVPYAGNRVASFQFDEAVAITNVLTAAQISAELAEVLKQPVSIEELRDGTAFPDDIDEALAREVEHVEQIVRRRLGDNSFWQAVNAVLHARMPKFFYFGHYQILPGRVDVRELTSEDEAPAQSSLQTARALMRLAGADEQILLADEFETRQAELEAVSNEITNEVFEYWTQSSDLSVVVQVDKVTEYQDGGQAAVVRYLDIRVHDSRHGFTGNFGQRSSGFQWFFSFLAAFSEFEEHEHGVIVLLDEPALNLHGRAQADFLRFINQRLAATSQVVYTTHSPFMVEPSHLDRVRIVEDKGPKEGAVVSQEVYSVGAESIFPLQAALGYDIAQNLFIGPDNLLVEGSSDLTYLQIMSDHLKSLGREGLSDRWRLLESNGATNLPTFVSLLGDKLDVTLLVDGSSAGWRSCRTSSIKRSSRQSA
jgi:predicted ATPase